MALRQQRQFEKVGLPELIAVVMLGAAFGAAIFWRQAGAEPSYRQAEGRVIDCNIGWMHYNAQDVQQRVSLTYQYNVGTTTYTGSWAGFWPESESPNALPANQIDALRTKGYPLLVLYDPDNPSTGLLHGENVSSPSLYGGLIVGICAVALIYCGILYPMWKARL